MQFTKKYGTPSIILLVFSFMLSTFTPWYWSGPVISFIIALIFKMTPLRAYSVSFGVHFLLWSILAMVQNINNHGILVAKIGQLFGGLSSMNLITITGTIGGLLGGFFGLAGSYWVKDQK